MSVDWSWLLVLGIVLVVAVLFVVSRYLDRKQDRLESHMDEIEYEVVDQCNLLQTFNDPCKKRKENSNGREG